MAEATPQYDLSMMWALAFARGLGEPPPLPEELGDVTDRAKFVIEIDGSFFTTIDQAGTFLTEFAQRLVEIDRTSGGWMRGISEALPRLNIGLRLWSGCLWAAKTIAIETRSGQNTPEMRSQAFGDIQTIGEHDPVFVAGVEAAPKFKKLREQEYSFEGVPEDSPVRRYPS